LFFFPTLAKERSLDNETSHPVDLLFWIRHAHKNEFAILECRGTISGYDLQSVKNGTCK